MQLPRHNESYLVGKEAGEAEGLEADTDGEGEDEEETGEEEYV